jgi:hypothetical protein
MQNRKNKIFHNKSVHTATKLLTAQQKKEAPNTTVTEKVIVCLQLDSFFFHFFVDKIEI